MKVLQSTVVIALMGKYELGEEALPKIIKFELHGYKLLKSLSGRLGQLSFIIKFDLSPWAVEFYPVKHGRSLPPLGH